MFQKIKEFLFGKLPAEHPPSVAVEAVPYKLEPSVTAPIPLALAQCGCGRSPTGLCVGLHKLSADIWAVHADNPVKAVPVVAAAATVKKPPAARRPVAKTAPVKAVPAKKPAAIKAAPKKPAAK